MRHFGIKLIAAILVLGTFSPLAFSSVRQQQMLKLLRSVSSPMSTARKGFEDPTVVTDDNLKSAIRKLGAALKALDRLKSTGSGSAPRLSDADNEKYRESYKQRMLNLIELIKVFRAEYEAVLATVPGERNFAYLHAV